MAQSGVSDRSQSMIKSVMRCLIAYEIRTVDLHLRGGGVCGEIRLTGCVLISTLDREEL